MLELVLTLVVGALVFDVLWGVISRFVLGAPSRWTEEVATFLLIWLVLLGAAVAFRDGEHLGVDFVVNKLDPGARRWSQMLVRLIVMGFATAVLVGGGAALVRTTLEAAQRTPALGVLMGYVYLAIPISGVCIVLFTLRQLADEAEAGEQQDGQASATEWTDG